MFEKKAVAIICSALMLGLSACASNSGAPHRDAGEFTSDAALTAKVKTAIAKDVGAGAAANINVNSYKGEVQLSGFVADSTQARRAGDVAHNVEGVRTVRNDVRVK